MPDEHCVCDRGGAEPSSTQEESEVTAARASTLCYLINDYRSHLDTTIHKESGQQYEQRKDGNQILQHENFFHGLSSPQETGR
jgi:hypothetical protein